MVEYFTRKIPYWPGVHYVLLSVSNFFKWDIQSLAKNKKVNSVSFGGNNITKFIACQVLANTLILKLKLNKNIIVISPLYVNNLPHQLNEKYTVKLVGTNSIK